MTSIDFAKLKQTILEQAKNEKNKKDTNNKLGSSNLLPTPPHSNLRRNNAIKKDQNHSSFIQLSHISSHRV